MRIISNFKDYYDGLQDFSKNRFNKIYIRKKKSLKKIVPFTEEEYNRIQSEYVFNLNGIYTFHYLFLAGKVYPCISSVRNNKVIYIWTYKDFEKQFEFTKRNKYKKEIERINQNFKSVKDFFDKDRGDFTRLHLLYDTPLFFISLRHQFCFRYIDKHYKVSVVINPQLKQTGFSKVLNSHQIYQELDYYLSNVMTKKETIEEPDDIIKLESKGFDKVVSFRKRKETENE